MMSNLSEDLVEEILSRVPDTSLKRLRSTCKQWNTLFKDKRFTNKHFRKAPKRSLILMLKEYRICALSVNLNVSPPSIDFKDDLGLKDYHSNSEQVDIAQVCHCDGLLLCNTNDNRLVVWNPFLGVTRWVQSKTSDKKFHSFGLGYQNNKYCRSYKIMRYWDNVMSDVPLVECEIYELSSDTWRVLDDNNASCLILGSGVSLKGNTYWLALDKGGDFLLCFDFTTERFRRFCLPSSQSRGCMALSAIKEEQLSVIHKRVDTSKMEIWLTNKCDIEGALLWSKSFEVDLHSEVFTSLLIDEEKKVALCCDLSIFDSETNKVYTVGEDNKYFSQIPFMEATDNGGH